MKKLLLAMALAVGALGATSHSAKAQTTTSNTAYTTTNNSNVAWTGTVEDWQVPRGGYTDASGYRPSTGTVAVNWVPRGGTCNIRYTETKEKYFKYRTSAGCDEVQHIVGSLLPGEQYRFEVAKDSWSGWSQSAVAMAQ
jgi:hypothetical protein